MRGDDSDDDDGGDDAVARTRKPRTKAPKRGQLASSCRDSSKNKELDFVEISTGTFPVSPRGAAEAA